MPQREDVVPKRRASAFKPPSLIKKGGSSVAHQKESAIAKKQKPLHQPHNSDKANSSEDIDSSSDVVVSSNPQDPSLTIPPKLLTKLLHHHFEDEKTRIGSDANALVAKYMETFVREALARAAYERSESGGGGIGGDFLEVEDLEKLAPQLLLDF